MYNQGVRFEANDLYDFTCGESAPIGNEDFWNKAQAAYTKNVEHLQNLETAEDLARLDQLLKDPAWLWYTIAAKALNHAVLACKYLREEGVEFSETPKP